LIEFALVAPLLLLILFAIFDVARALNYLNEETNLANVAARYASVVSDPICPAGCTNADGCTAGTAATNLYGYIVCTAAGDSASMGGVGVCINDETTSNAYATGDALKVTVIYPYNFLAFVSHVVGKTSITLTSSATMMLESSRSSASWLSGVNTQAQNPSANGTAGYTQCSAIT
jgi:Flp pilus assembly protein TadG